jgi:hypothetical protein
VSDTNARTTLDRLLAVDWSGEGSLAHRRSRIKLMREYLRRSAVQARQLGVTDVWPFFDVAEYAARGTTVPADLAARLGELTSGPARYPAVARSCWGALHWGAAMDAGALPADADDPYEPLLLFFERGGGFYLEEGFIDVEGGSVVRKTWQDHVDTEPLDLSPAVLDAFDAVDAGLF